VSTDRDTLRAPGARITAIRARSTLAEILLRARATGGPFMQSTHAPRFASSIHSTHSTQGGGTFFATQGAGAP
jgi:hypothetical protein